MRLNHFIKMAIKAKSLAIIIVDVIQTLRKQELSYGKRIARQLHKHYNNNTMTLKSGLEVTQCH